MSEDPVDFNVNKKVFFNGSDDDEDYHYDYLALLVWTLSFTAGVLVSLSENKFRLFTLNLYRTFKTFFEEFFISAIVITCLYLIIVNYITPQSLLSSNINHIIIMILVNCNFAFDFGTGLVIPNRLSFMLFIHHSFGILGSLFLIRYNIGGNLFVHLLIDAATEFFNFSFIKHYANQFYSSNHKKYIYITNLWNNSFWIFFILIRILYYPSVLIQALMECSFQYFYLGQQDKPLIILIIMLFIWLIFSFVYHFNWFWNEFNWK